MKYVMLIHHGTTPVPGTEAWEELSREEQGEIYAAYKKLNETPGVTPGEPMDKAETATTVRVEANGKAIATDGPFAELKEAIAGIFYVEADDLDAAIEIAALVPSAGRGGAVEIRPAGTYY